MYRSVFCGSVEGGDLITKFHVTTLSRKKRTYPDLSQLQELPVQLAMTVPPDWEDRNGHMNVQFYVTLYELGGWAILEDTGIDEAWFEQHDVGLFDLEHHLQYRAEIVVGDDVKTYNRLIHRSEKCFHGMYFVVNETRKRLAATLEYITACVDMKSRRIAPFTDELAGDLDSILRNHQQLKWDTPVCGMMKP